MLRIGEMESVLRKPVREYGHVPGQARRLSAEELDALVAGYREGRTVRQLAAEFRISRGVAAEHLKNRGIVMRPTLLDAETKRALELHTDGLSANRIGQIIGRDPKTVRAMIRRDQATD